MTVELMQVIRGAGLAALLTASPLAAQQASPVQALYTSAEAREAAGDHAGALADFTAMEARLSGQPASPNLALARIGQARMLIALGRQDEALSSLDAALGSGALDRPALIAHRIEGLETRAALRFSRLDHRGAATDYIQLAGLVDEAPARMSAFAGAARAQTFLDPAGALVSFGKADAAAREIPNLGREEQSNLSAIHGRILLNRGDAEAARRAFEDAVRLRGGLTQSGTLAEFAIRADAALANLQLGRQEDARRYLAFSGAGMARTQMPRPLVLSRPPCGVDGVEPDDRFVVEFGIARDGTVPYAQPIFASRPGAGALRFAEEVRQWTFPAERLEGLPLYFQHGSRVELRCSRTAPRPTHLTALDDAYASWWLGLGTPQSLPASNEELVAFLAAPGRTPLERFGAQYALSRDTRLSLTARRRAWEEAERLMRELEAPPAARASLALRQPVRRLSDLEQVRAALLAEPAVAADPVVRSAIRIEQARWDDGDPGQPVAALRAVAEDPALPDRDPLRIAALVALANLHAREGRLDQAEAAYADTGLTAQQCALLDGTQRLRRRGEVSFPDTAQRWGFEGWTSVEFDVSADGRTQQVRTVAAYPPAVFSDAARIGIERSRYDIAYRPGGDPGCTGASMTFSFQIAN